MQSKQEHTFFCVQAEALGAWKNGTRVIKVRSGEGDTHVDGAPATIIGSAGPVEAEGIRTYVYFVEWDDAPGIPVGIRGDRIALP
jgi:hypothetical protein